MSTTSCFAPRIPDKVDHLSILAKKYKIFHVVNNAYGVWCSKIAHMLGEGWRKGECTVVVQSTDKNFMVPVGGSFIFCQDPKLLEKSTYLATKFHRNTQEEPMEVLFSISS
jgi:O-phospho-L-seryl-tRNASec:L-selenocysteinyl-tRNA synthase